MRALTSILALGLTATISAQDWSRDAAASELRELVLTARPMQEWPARDAAIGGWLAKTRSTGVELGDHRFLVGVAQYFTKDYEGAADMLLAELERLQGRLPTSDFDTIVGRALMADGIRSIREGEIDRARRGLPFAARLYSDPAMVYRAAVTALLRADGDGAGALLDETLRAMFTDDRLDAAARQQVLKAVYAPPARAADADRAAAAAAGPALQPFVATDLDGAEVSLSALEGQVVLVDFWATWCGPCIREMPNVVAAHRRFREQGFTVVGISLDEEPGQQRGGPIVAPEPDGAMVAKIRATMERLGMDWRVIYEGGGWGTRLAKDNGIRSIPATFLIDRTGKVRFTNLRGEELAQRVGELVGER